MAGIWNGRDLFIDVYGKLSFGPSLVAPGHLGRPVCTNLSLFTVYVKGASPIYFKRNRIFWIIRDHREKKLKSKFSRSFRVFRPQPANFNLNWSTHSDSKQSKWTFCETVKKGKWVIWIHIFVGKFYWREGHFVEEGRFPCCVLLALSWNATNENPSTDKLSGQSTRWCYFYSHPCPFSKGPITHLLLEEGNLSTAPRNDYLIQFSYY